MDKITCHLPKIIQKKVNYLLSSDIVVKSMDFQRLEKDEYSYFLYALKKDLYFQIDNYVENNEININFIFENLTLLKNIIAFFNLHGGEIKYSLSPTNQIIQLYNKVPYILTNKDIICIYLYNTYYELDIHKILQMIN